MLNNYPPEVSDATFNAPFNQSSLIFSIEIKGGYVIDYRTSKETIEEYKESLEKALKIALKHEEIQIDKLNIETELY